MKVQTEERVVLPKEVIIGDPKAKVLLTEFGDYESADTAKNFAIVKHLLQKYEGKIKYNYRHFPLTKIHQRSFKAAEAAIGASQEGKFWEMHEILLSHQRNLGTISLKGYAKEAGVVAKNFLDSLMNSKYGWYVREDQFEAVAAGIVSPPAFLINGKIFDGKISESTLSEAIEKALKSKKRA